jgi:hypothetical protein
MANGGYRINFALPNCDTNFRLNVHIKDPLTEKIYFGFQKAGTSNPQTFQIRKPDGTAV